MEATHLGPLLGNKLFDPPLEEINHNDDVIFKILMYLRIPDLVKFVVTSKNLHQKGTDIRFWKCIEHKMDPNTQSPSIEKIKNFYYQTIRNYKMWDDLYCFLNPSEKSILDNLIRLNRIDDFGILSKIRKSEEKIAFWCNATNITNEIYPNFKSLTTINNLFELADETDSWFIKNKEYFGSKTTTEFILQGECGQIITKLPSEISFFINLTKLSCVDKRLYEFSDGITLLTNLTELKLCGNRFKSIPPQIGLMSNLKILNFRANNFSYEKNESMRLSTLGFDHFTALKSLDISSNKLMALPHKISLLTALMRFDIRNTYLEKIPAEIKYLSNLKSLNVSQNELREIPCEFSYLTNLNFLDLSYTRLNDFPCSILSISSLEFLKLKGNNLSTIPCGIEPLTNLTKLSLANNSFSVFPMGISIFPKLMQLNFNNNRLKTLPHEITQLTNLTMLGLKNNGLRELPETLEDLNLGICLLSYNFLTKLERQYFAKMDIDVLRYDENNALDLVENELENKDYPSYSTSIESDSVESESDETVSDDAEIDDPQGNFRM